MNLPTDRRARLIAVALAALVVALVVAACGSSSSGGSGAAASSTTGTNGTTTTGAGGRTNTKLAACLQQQGVTLPSRPGRADGGPPAARTGTNPAPPAGTGTGTNARRAPGGGLFGGSGMSAAQRTKLQAALRRCGASFGGGRFKGGNSAAYRTAIAKFVACVRGDGYDLPAPNTSGKGPVFDPSKVNQRDPKWIKASKACQSLLPQGRPGGQGGAGAGGGQPPAAGGAS
ncbi:MAG: hypothetical protein JWQ48_4064 [Conexibacter sp.]|nr:hypothetical protein [Conexibacter sp.]